MLFHCQAVVANSQDPSYSTSALQLVLSSAGSCPEGKPTGMQILFKCISEECEILENKGENRLSVINCN